MDYFFKRFLSKFYIKLVVLKDLNSGRVKKKEKEK